MAESLREEDEDSARVRFLDAWVRYRCVGREARVSHWKVTQAIYDRMYQEGLIALQVHYTGSMY